MNQPSTSTSGLTRSWNKIAMSLLCVAALTACGSERSSSDEQTSTGTDASATDAASADVGPADAGAAATDTGAVATDGGQVDAGGGVNADTDAGSGGDASAEDADSMDAGATDAGSMDAGAADAGSVDAGGEQSLFSWGPKQCKKAGSGVGYDVGQQLGDLTVTDCDTGATRSIEEICGADATWLFVAHSHCPTCQATAGYTKKLATDLANKNIAIVHVVQIDDSQTCPGWRKAYGLAGLPNVRVYRENTGAAWKSIKTKNYTAPHVIMGPDRVITFKAHGLSSSAVKSKLLAAMKP